MKKDYYKMINKKMIWSVLLLLTIAVFFFFTVWDYKSYEPHKLEAKGVTPLQKEQTKVIQNKEVANNKKADTIKGIIDDISVKTTILLDSLNYLKNQNQLLQQDLYKAQNFKPEPATGYYVNDPDNSVKLLDSIVMLRSQIDSQGVLCNTRDSANAMLLHAYEKILCERDSLQSAVGKLQKKRKRDKWKLGAAAAAVGALIIELTIKK